MVVISTQAERWALSEDGPGAVGLLQKIDEFIGILAENSETLPFLKKCRLYVHSERADLVDEDNIRVSANGLVENGPAATAELFISKIREQEEQERLASKASEAAPPEGFEKKEGGVTEEGGEQNENAESPKPEEGEDREGLPKEPSNRIPPQERSGWREKVSETASRLAKRFGINDLIDSAKIAYSNELADWHTNRALSLKEEMEDYRRKVRNSEEDRQHLEAQAKKFREEGEVSASALVEIEKERAKVEEDIERNKEAADSLQSALEYRNNQRARYENRRNEICRVYMDRVAERADPFEEKLSDLKLTREQLNEEIGHHRELLAVRNAKLAELRKLVDAEKFMSVRRAHREMIKKIERAAQEISEEIVAREEDRGKIDKKIIKQDKKANPLRDQYNRLARITKRRGPDTSVGAPKEREQASLETREVGGHPMIEGEEDTDRRDESSYPSRKSRPEFEKKYSAEELVETWNKANGSRMKISLETAKKNFPKFFEGEESVDDFWRFTGFYAERFGDQERFEGMPNMQKAARRKRGFWSRLFGRENRSRNQSRFLDFLGRK